MQDARYGMHDVFVHVLVPVHVHEMPDAGYRMTRLALEYIDVPAQQDSMCGCNAAGYRMK